MRLIKVLMSDPCCLVLLAVAVIGLAVKLMKRLAIRPHSELMGKSTQPKEAPKKVRNHSPQSVRD